MSSVTLTPGQTLDIPYEIVIPSDATPGGYFGAIFWGSSPTEGEGAEALAVGAKVGILVFLTPSRIDMAKGLQNHPSADNPFPYWPMTTILS
jgi:hypothetical protein